MTPSRRGAAAALLAAYLLSCVRSTLVVLEQVDKPATPNEKRNPSLHHQKKKKRKSTQKKKGVLLRRLRHRPSRRRGGGGGGEGEDEEEARHPVPRGTSLLPSPVLLVRIVSPSDPAAPARPPARPHARVI